MWAGEAVPAASTLTSVFLQYGAIGAMVVVLALFAWNQIKREREQSRMDRDEVRWLNDLIISTTVPALTKATDTMGTAITLLGALEEQQRIERAVRERDKDSRRRE